MIEFKKNLNRYYDTKHHHMVSQATAMKWAMNHGKLGIKIVNGNKHTKRGAKKSKRSRKSSRPASYSRPSYKALYKNVSKRLNKTTKQLQKVENQYSVNKFTPFVVHRTKDGDISPKTNYDDVKEWSKDHHMKLFVVAALGSDKQSIVKACGSVDDLTAAGFAARELVPGLVQIFEDGYND